MAKHDWEALQAAFLADNADTGITAQQWCEQHGLNYQSARRYIKPRAAQSAQKKPRRTAHNAQSDATAQQCANSDDVEEEEQKLSSDTDDDRDPESEPAEKPNSGRSGNGQFTKGNRHSEGNAGNPNPVGAFTSGNQAARKHGAYILFAHGSSIQVATSFRSGTVQRLHISEHGKICAKYPAKAKEVRTGTLNAIHDGCIVFIESTAEGVGGDFHSMSTRSMELAQSNIDLTDQDYRFHFFAWWQDPKYQAPVPDGGLRLSKYHQEYFSAVEQAMGITLLDEQKQWYIRKEIEQQEEMKQEFPSTPSEAFLTSGRRVFAAINVMQAEGQCKSPLLVYDIEPVTGKRIKVQALRAGNAEELQRTLLNHLLVWELPDPDEDYAIGGDVAEGLENGDRSSFDVVKKSTGEQVAHWFGYLDAELFAQLLAHVGKWYNTAFIGPERNNHGHAVIQKLREVYPHRSIYSEQYLDRDHDDETPKLGWLTTAQSKPVIIEGLKSLLRENASGVRWIGTINELNTYVYDARGRMNAQTGCFDDQVMSYAIAQEMRARMPARPKHEPIDRSKPKHWMAI